MKTSLLQCALLGFVLVGTEGLVQAGGSPVTVQYQQAKVAERRRQAKAPKTHIFWDPLNRRIVSTRDPITISSIKAVGAWEDITAESHPYTPKGLESHPAVDHNIKSFPPQKYTNYNIP